MESVRQIIDSTLLNGIVSLPQDFQNKKVEIIVRLQEHEEKNNLPALTKNSIDEMLKGSVTESLIGILQYSHLSIEDYRAERLSKYECAD